MKVDIDPEGRLAEPRQTTLVLASVLPGCRTFASGAATVAAALGFFAPALGAGAPAPFDLLIRNGTVIDGSGALPVRTDVAVRGELIEFIGDGSKLEAGRIVDARGLIVAPGFIDPHSHADGVLVNPAAPQDRVSLATASQGVTTAVFGPDGFYSLATIRQRMQAFSSGGVGVNYAFYVGHNGIRRETLGDPHAKATHGDIARMAAQVRDAMVLGAVGLSTGLMYDPGMFADTEEVVALAREVAPFGGIYDSHVRDPVFHLIDSDKEALEIGRRAGIGAKIAHEKAPGLLNHGRAVDIVALINSERSAGFNAVVDQYPYDGASTGLLRNLFVLPDSPRGARPDTPLEQLRKMLSDSKQRAVVRQLSENGIDGGFTWLKAVGYGGLRIVSSPDDPALVGRNIELLARERGASGFDTLADLAMHHDSIRLTMADIAESDIRLLMVQPWTMIGSDGNGIDAARDPRVCEHPRSLGTFPRVLGHYARDLGVLSLPDAIRKMTSLPADYLHLSDRGRIQQGKVADITVFDPARVSDRATYEKPCELSVGITHVFVNGVAVFEEGRATGALPGRFVKRAGPHSTGD